MKSIVYILIAVFAGGIFASVLPKVNVNGEQKITLQSTNDPSSIELLNKSGEIILSRLQDYGIKNVDVAVQLNTSDLVVSLDKRKDVNSIKNLFLNKGVVEFYEVFDDPEMIQNHGGLEELKALIDMDDNRNGILGSCSEDQKPAVEQFLAMHYVSKPGKGICFAWSQFPNKNGKYDLYMLHPESSMNYSNIQESLVVSDDSNNKNALLIEFDETGTIVWQELTRKNIGKPIAIVMDNFVITAPRVMDEITEGLCLITGNFSMEEIKYMQSLIANDILPLNFEITQ